MKIAIKDANIIIDLHNINLLDAFLSLDYYVMTTDMVRSEIKGKDLKRRIDDYCDGNILRIETLSYDELLEINRIKAEQPGLSVPDCSVVLLAKKFDAMLLSGDRLLRNKANELGIECHGILWIMDELVLENRITPRIASQKLKDLMATNNRLPHSECHKRLDKWKK